MKDKIIPIGKAAQILGVSINTLRRWDEKGRLKSKRNGELGHRYYLQSQISDFMQDVDSLAKNWVMAPIGETPQPDMYCRTRDAFQARLEKFQSKLTPVAPLETVSLVTAVAGEIGNNSFDHNLGNWPDTPGIVFAYSLRTKTVVLADRGQGVLATLQRVRPQLTTAEDALKVAFTEIVSGRYPEARGNGLKFVRQVITTQPFTLDFQTGDAYIHLKRNDSQVRVIKTDTDIRGCFVIIGFGGLI